MRKVVNAKYVKKHRNLQGEIVHRYYFLTALIFILFLALTINLYAIQINEHEYHLQKLAAVNRQIVYGETAPRGRIYDRNHRLIVDNEPIKTITYQKLPGVTRQQEMQMAYWLADAITVPYEKLSERQLKEFWLFHNPEEGKAKITKEEWQQLSERRLTRTEIRQMKFARISDKDLEQFTKLDKQAAYIYFLMNDGYWFSRKNIKNQAVSEKEYALVSENLDQLPGFATNLSWQRTYPYEEVFRSILGRVSSGLPAELKDHYLAEGYRLDDRVGASYIEKQFDEYLRGQKAKYELINGQRHLIADGKRGHDIVLTIDIELQKQVEAILKKELLQAKEEPNTEYLDRAFVVIQNPQNGEILAMAAKKVYETEDGFDVYDYIPGVLTDSIVPGSVVKGASHMVAYNNDALTIGERRRDFCIKIANTPAKCSWTNLGLLDDITAMSRSSNSYQYQSAIKVGGAEYHYNQPLSIDKDAFTIYRDGFAQFGLGVKTEIDLPNETRGYRGTSLSSGHLLDFAIGQYDNYTPLQLSQYVSTIANDGLRLKPQILKQVYQPSEPSLTYLVHNQTREILNELDGKEEYLTRIQEGFRRVMQTGGTGFWHAPRHLEVAGKTGTSESFVDTTGDGMIDQLTLSNAFVAYAPFEEPIVSFTVATPNFYHKDNPSTRRSFVNRRISQQVIENFFAIYE